MQKIYVTAYQRAGEFKRAIERNGLDGYNLGARIYTRMVRVRNYCHIRVNCPY